MILRLLRGALASLAVVLGPLGAPVDASASARASGLKLIGSVAIDARMRELTFSTPALAGPVKVRVLVPRDAAAHPEARYPALYLLHGSGGDEKVWTNLDAEALTEGLGLVVVMPDGGHDGWYTDWFGGGQPQWERFHVDQLIPWIDAHEPVIAARGKRAIAGLSMGGFGALSYAARHPDLFVAASSFSGALDLGVPADAGPSLVGVQPWGPWDGPQVRWRGHNPADLAGNLRGIAMSIYTGEGDGGDAIEPVIHAESESFARRAGALGIARQYVDYGRGGHDGELFKRDLQQALPGLMEVLDHPPDPPSPFSFTATEQAFTVRGYSVRAARDALAFRTLSRVRAAGFTLATDGPTTVVTARRYVRRARYRVAVRPRGGGAAAVSVLRSTAEGRLRIVVGGSASVGITRAAAAS
ncbi:MAG: esterase family protein [Conexibacter sp.]|nr:esterase family protein [Conexibacter sp.]